MSLPRWRRTPRPEALSAANERFVRDLIESGPDALVIVDREAAIVLVNAQTEKLFGYQRSELIGKPVETLLPERLRDRHRRHRDDFLANPSTRPMGADLDLMARRRDGTEFPVDISLSPLHTGDGLFVAGAIRDVSERKRVEDERRRSEVLFRGLLESAPDAIVIVDADARIVLVNGQTERLFGYDRATLVGQPIELLLPERLREQHQAHRTGYLAQPSARPMGAGLELLGRRSDGSEFPVDISLSPHDTPDGTLVLSAIRDVTAQRRSEGEMRRYAADADKANAAKSEFLSRMSHELRTPLNSILGFAQILELDGLSLEQRANVGYIVRAGRHLLSLINEVLDMAQIESGRLELSLETVAIGAVVDEALSLVEPLASERGITIHVLAPDPDVVYGFADQQRLLQVLLNVLGNAVKYSPSRTTVEVSWGLVEAGDRLRIAVRDEGPGIPSDELERIFAPFERLADSATNIEGTGLGLALAQNLVEAMGGSISVESRLGEGSTFSIELEAAVGDALEVPEVAAPFFPTTSAARTVLHIEDNLVGQRLVEQVLRQLPGVEVLAAAQGSMGVDFARRYRPGVILLDLHLPDQPGEEVLQRLRADRATRDIPVIVLSADTSRDVAERLLRAGARLYLTKPIDADVLLAAVDEVAGPARGSDDQWGTERT